jgi:hypothetical protein
MIFAWSASHALAGGLNVVPPGNRNAEQPKVPGASVRRTKAGRSTFDEKYDKIRELLASDKSLISKIKHLAPIRYRSDPYHRRHRRRTHL